MTASRRSEPPRPPALPEALHVTVAWGVSVLSSRRLDPRPRAVLIPRLARLERHPDRVELVLAERGEETRRTIARGDRLVVTVGDYAIAIDAEASETFRAPFALPRGALLSQLGSWALHGGLLALLVAFRPALAAAEIDAPSVDASLVGAERPDPLQRAFTIQDPIGSQADSGVATAPSDDLRAPGAAGLRRSPSAARGTPKRTVGPRALPPSVAEPAQGETTSPADWLSAMGLEDPSKSPPSASPWDGAANYASEGERAAGASAGAMFSQGLDEGAGGLGLSGIGEGGGHGGMGVPWGGTLGGLPRTPIDDGAMSWALGRVGHESKLRPPRFSVDYVSVSGRLPPEVVQRIVRQNHGRMRACYTKAFGMREVGPAGRVSVRFVIGRDGSVSGASGSGDLPSQEVISCVTRAFASLSFPQPEGGSVVVVYPIAFSSE